MLDWLFKHWFMVISVIMVGFILIVDGIILIRDWRDSWLERKRVD